MSTEPEADELKLGPITHQVPLLRLGDLTDSGTTGRALVTRLLGGPRRWRRREVARSVGVSLLSARKLWRALGFANVTDEDVAFTDADVDALTRTVRLVREGLIDEPTAIALARAVGQTTDRLVSWQTEAIREHLATSAGPADPALALAHLDRILDDLEHLLVYSWRRQLAAAVTRMTDARPRDMDSSATLTVGFADLVSYTRLSQRLLPRDLGALVQRFEGLASDVVTAGNGRVVKTVGDEVLFTADDPVAAAVIALSLSEEMARDEMIPDVRVGICHGRVLRSLGDVYGPTVNLASRLTRLAQPGTVVTDAATAAVLARRPGFVLVPQPSRWVNGFGQVTPLLLTRQGSTAGVDLDLE